MVWYKNIRVKKVTQASKALTDNLFLLQDVSNLCAGMIEDDRFFYLGTPTSSVEHSRNVLPYQ